MRPFVHRLWQKWPLWPRSYRRFFLEVLLICAIVPIFLLISPWIGRWYVADLLSQDLVKQALPTTSQWPDYEHQLSQWSSKFQYQCHRRDVRQLQYIAYQDHRIRRILIETPRGKRCSSFQDGTFRERRVLLAEQTQSHLSFWLSKDDYAEENLLIAQWRDHSDSKLEVSFEPILASTWQKKYGSDHLLLSFVVDGKLYRYRGNANLRSQPILLSVPIVSGTQFQVRVSSKLLQSYQAKFYYPLAFLGVVVSLVILSLHYWKEKQRQSLHTLINQGIKKHEFLPFYQPIVDVNSGCLYGCEMLARWKRNHQELISPMEFIPYVEKSGQILPITEQLIEQTLSELRQLNWDKTNQIISINVVPEHFQDEKVLKNALALVAEHQFHPQQIAFEVTERKQFTDLLRASEMISKLSSQGFGVKLDDAGTGYGGFSYIQELNLRSLKIDKMFIDNIGTSDLKLSLLNSIIAFGREAGMEMIAEGVETKAQSEYLLAHGVHLQQGYYFGRPMPFEQFAKVYKKAWL